MKHQPRLLEILTRAVNVPIMAEVDFELQLVGATIKRLVDDCGIYSSGEVCVNMDADLADRVYQVGLEFASQVGVFNQSTSRLITWKRAEIEAAIRACQA